MYIISTGISLLFFLLVLMISFNLKSNFSFCYIHPDYLGSNLNISYSYCLDNISLICIIMLLSCFIIASFFYWHYFNWHSDYLIVNIQLFVSSMLFLILTNDCLNSFIGWEYLGMSSFFLILYYSIYCSSRSALVTMISSRLGDVGFFIFVSYYYYNNENVNTFVLLFLCLLLISKTAVYPMSSWLLEAMRAPTPVSSLVHSSTLVASGVWLLCRYEGELLYSGISESLLLLSLISVIISALCAFIYSDTKKIIALSTCNNISWCYVYIYLGGVEIGLIQLLCHGIFKCMMFCLIGDLLVNSNNSQNKSYHYFISSYGFSYIIGLIGLFISGFPFLGLYFSKHLFINFIENSGNLLMCLLIILGISLSFLYTFRLISVILNFSNSSSEGFNNSFYFISSITPFSLIVNNWISGGELEDTLCSSNLSVLINSLIFFMSVAGWSYMYINSSSWLSGLFGQDYIINLSQSFNSTVNNLIYFISVWRWESSLLGWYNSFRFNSNNLLNYNYLFIMSLMFYLILLSF